ncbi:MAG TPA: hypothetical protein VLH77_04115, partial [Gammaproteobacteria bacterium]|nr:hypothetical protein [Gammaproteobacteria bacterium]
RISSTRLNKSYYVLKLISVPFFIPLGIAGAILKGLSHFDPSVRAANNHVRGKLTPENHIIQEAGEMPLRDASIPYENPEEKGHTLHMSALENRLKELLKTGQKIGDLTIRAETQVLDDICLSLIAQINPKNVLLINSTGNERWKLTGGLCPINIIRSTSNITKWAKWDLSPIGFDENAIDSSVMATRSVKSAEQKQTGQLPDPPIYQKRTEPAAAEEAKQELKPSLLSIYKKTKHTHAIRVVSQDAISHSPQRR